MQVNLPDTLPSDPKGFTQRMKMHLNFGRDGGAAVYSIHDPHGIELPITYQYDSRKKGGGPTGLFIDGVDRCFTKWSDLAAYWPEYINSKSGGAA